MKIRCNDCGNTGLVAKRCFENVKQGIAVHCPICNRKTPHQVVGPQEVPSATEHKVDVLLQHCELHHEGYPLIPEGCDECVIGTFDDEDEEHIHAVISLQRLQQHFEQKFSESEDPVQAAKDWIDSDVLPASPRIGGPLFVEEVMRCSE